MEKRKKTLLQKYEIPLNHLDFRYIEASKDAREMERIVQILRSGEEGYYPDLTKCAEEKLRELKPQSKLFSYEEHLTPGGNECKSISDFAAAIKSKDQELVEVKAIHPESDQVILPIRPIGIIKQSKSNEHITKHTEMNKDCIKKIKPATFTDYSKWDKYDSEVELLRMDLSEERIQEEVERKNLLNLQKSSQPLQTEDIKQLELLQDFSNVEREKMSQECRYRGNEYYRTKEYDKAIYQYNLAIQIYPEASAPVYNNRAITNMKLQKYLHAIDDCKHCLKQEPNNLKARLRHAQATYSFGRRRESYDLYLKVLELDPHNATALKSIAEIRKQLGDLPPPNATRIQITEGLPSTTATSNTVLHASTSLPVCADLPTTSKHTEKQLVVFTNNEINKSKQHNPKSSCENRKEYDLASLIIPNHIMKSKLRTAAEGLRNLANTNPPKVSMNERPSSALPGRTSPPPLISIHTTKSERFIEEIE